MTIQFRTFSFEVVDEKIIMSDCGKFKNCGKFGFVEAQLAGGNKISHAGVKMIGSSEGSALRYVSHELEDDHLSIIQESSKIRASTVFTGYKDTNTVRVYTEVTNISDETITLEELSSIVLGGLSVRGYTCPDGLYITKFIQSHHAECQPRRLSFYDLGFLNDPAQPMGQKRISFANVGSWSTKEELPYAIIENTELSQHLMFQIESASSWYYEISGREKDMYLYLGGANSTFGGWSKDLLPGESYRSLNVAIAFGEDLNEVVGEMTKYRRHISGLCGPDSSLPTIFNEYMHLSWNDPSEATTKIYAPAVAKTGAKYYVIDCGWHDEVPGDIVFNYVGKWEESKCRFPSGVKATTDFIRSLGMKAGLWIEPEVVGVECKEMIEFYGDECFYRRHGKKILIDNRYFLDYRHPKVISHMTEVIRRMVEDYGADYIKFDYNQDVGVGTDYQCTSPGEGLELCVNAFFDWLESIKKKFPNVIFEGCASGGMRIDYKSLSSFSLVSTSDQTNFTKYPYIAGNILSAVIPEQAAVWSYPTGHCKKDGVNSPQIIINMVNSLLGRLHLASHLEWMNKEQLGLVAEGIQVYNNIAEYKHKALPYFPKGFTEFGKPTVVSGLKHEKEIYLAVWNLLGADEEVIKLCDDIETAEIVYPFVANSELRTDGDTLTVVFNEERCASFIKITLK
ncbi:MAG: hypothetical protein E7623_06205 [Ruminococcaceae bacterium]|nr:hypothetical protein [Oscillospiraceae bacterium]